MPQMSPLSWLILFIVFSISFIMFNMINFFYIMYVPMNFLMNNQKKNKMNWKW